jgi:hypothetical protein
MYRILIVLAVCGVGIAQQPSVGIFLDFEKAPPPALLDSLRSHAESLLKPAGVLPVWRLLSENKGNELFSDVLIVRFKGGCNGRAPLSPLDDSEKGSTRLGATKVREGRVLPWAEVECDAVKQGVAKVAPKRRLRVFGQALAKVLSHELYHLLLNTTGHGRRGLSRPALEWEELMSGKTRFESGELDRSGRGASTAEKKDPPRP